MPETIICSGCKSPIDVPDDHKSPMIHCGICWAEVAIPSRAEPPKVLPVAPVAMPAALPARSSQSGIRPAPSGIKAAPSGIRPATGQSGIQPAPKNLSGVRQAEALPGGAKPPAKGMAPLEVLINKAATRLKPQAPTPSAAPAAPSPVRDSQIVMKPPIDDLPIEDIEVMVVEDAPPPMVAEVITRKSTPEIAPVEPPPIRRKRNPEGSTDEDSPRSRRSDSKTSKYRKREQTEDDDDDHPRRRRRTTNTSPLIAVIIGGVVTLLLMIGGAWYMLSGSSGSTTTKDVAAGGGNPAFGNLPANGADAAANKPLPQLNPPPIDNGMPQPGAVQPPRPPQRNVLPPFNPDKPFPDPAWVAVTQAEGFDAQMLGEARVWDRHSENLYDANFINGFGKGKTYRSSGPWYNFEIRIADAPKDVQPNLPKILAFPFFREDQAKAASFAGQQGYEIISKDNTKTEIRRITQVGCRVFIFKAELRSMFGRTQEDIDGAKSKFLDSIKITFDAMTPAPIDPNLRRR